MIKRPKTGQFVCKECFFELFETEVHETIVRDKMFKKGQRVAIGASGGKDSTTLAYVLSTLNKRYNYGLDLYLLSIDEGIVGYRDDSLATVKQNAIDYDLPLEIVSYKDLFGYTMDSIVQQTSNDQGYTKACSYCGVLRRQALNIGAERTHADLIATGHNADDNAETVIMNIFRGDIHRLTRQSYAEDAADRETFQDGNGGRTVVPRCKPLRLCYQKEIVLYAHFKKLLYFSVECTYSKFGYRGNMRQFLAQAQLIRPEVVANVINSSDGFELSPRCNLKRPVTTYCANCGYPCSQKICQCCSLIDSLNKKDPKSAFKHS
ncbi:hypothetical protein BLSTO_02305 [Blastocystis sp. subtype 1]